jgi:glycosyltransferase 2 family protein
MSSPLRRISRVAGWIAVAVCLAFLAYRLDQVMPDVRAYARRDGTIGAFVAALTVYSIAGLLLALAWWGLLRAASARSVPIRASAAGHLMAQVAKYVPGNVFHFAARHAKARSIGIDHSHAGIAALAESLLLASTAALLSMATTADSLPEGARWLVHVKWGIPLVVLAALAFAWRRAGPRDGPDGARSGWQSGWLCASLCHLAFFVLAAIAFSLLLGPDGPALSTLIPIVAIAWLGGFLVIGAPGGIGVREAILVGLLGGLVGEPLALYAGLAFRAVTVLGDFVAFAIGSALAWGRASA